MVESDSEITPILPARGASLNNGQEPNTTKSFSFRMLNRRKKLIYVMMALVNLLACTCFALPAPFFPGEAHKKGASQTVVGLIFCTFELVIFISAPIYGNFLVTIGARFMFVAGIMTSGCTAILFGLLDQCPPGWPFITLCFAVRSVEALGCSAYVTALLAILAHEFPGQVATVVGSLETFSGIGLMAGPALGGALYQIGGYGFPFWVLGSTLVSCGVLNAIFLPNQEDDCHSRKGSVFTLLRSARTWVTMMTVICCSFGLVFLDPTLADHLAEFQLKPAFVGLVFLVGPAVYALTAPLWGWISDTKGMVLSLMLVGTFFSAVSFLIIGPTPLLPFLPKLLWVIIVGLSLMGLCLGCSFIPTFTSFLIAARELGLPDSFDTQGLVSGIFNSCFSLGAFMGPMFGGLMQQYLGFPWASTACTFFILLGTVLLALFTMFERHRQKRLQEKKEMSSADPVKV